VLKKLHILNCVLNTKSLAHDFDEFCPKESLLHRLQAQTLPDATSLKRKIHPSVKKAVTFEPMMHFLFL
jgi:hypothetical protein